MRKNVHPVGIRCHDSNSRPLEHESPPITIRPVHPPFNFSILISPNVLNSTSDVQHLPMSDRNCKFHNEATHSEIFSKYSHNGCMFECLISQAEKECSCIPWNLPSTKKESYICDPSGSSCFWSIMNQGGRILNCSCAVDCSQTNYDFYHHTQDIADDEFVSLKARTCGYQVF